MPARTVRDRVGALPVFSYFFLAYALVFVAYLTYLAFSDLPFAPFWFVGVFSPTSQGRAGETYKGAGDAAPPILPPRRYR
ncbi:MAG TPA: hypothetical protein VMS99_15540 [Acidimicrobiia bacterium]|nr:hypothetical protein [Acidimicrobiia bacterium]